MLLLEELLLDMFLLEELLLLLEVLLVECDLLLLELLWGKVGLGSDLSCYWYYSGCLPWTVLVREVDLRRGRGGTAPALRRRAHPPPSLIPTKQLLSSLQSPLGCLWLRHPC